LAIPGIGILMGVPGLIKEAMTLSVGSKKKCGLPLTMKTIKGEAKKQ
jgi:hypothetical protein